jgi:predicted AlkP superfamily pyrophosphatase or phosphodiesterase
MARASRNKKEDKPLTARMATLIVIACFSGYSLMHASETRLPRLLRNEGLNVNATLEAYANYDISFKVAHDLLSTISDFSILRLLRGNAHLVPTASAASDDTPTTPSIEEDGFYGYLKKNTNLMSSVKVDPVDINLVADLKPTSGNKPNIFIFVVDSLRADYLSPYNNKVSFTPNIESFARESVVMENAFTPYGGTVLAEPSIWTGTMQIHKQYVEPFYPMNALQKLIETDNYEPFITIDPVLKIILRPSSSIVELDKDMTGWQGLDMVNTLKELRTKLEERQDKTRPIFAYTQPQNLHVHKLNRERRSGPAVYEFPGFESYYASQVKRIDESLGEFIQYLKASGQYDNSVIVLTSDHGDSLGEGGRWGHATWIFPEILKIPIIIHLPSEYQKSLYWDPQTVALLDDLTPSLYYLLGHRPILRNDLFGKPLFTQTQREQGDYQKRSYMIASSYGPSYGILGNNGHSLFISDAINSRDYFFNLKVDPMGTRNIVNGEIRAQNEKLIRHDVDAINDFFHFDPDNSQSTGK